MEIYCGAQDAVSKSLRARDGTVSSELRAQMDRRGRNAAFVEALRQHHPAREEPLGSGMRPEERPLGPALRGNMSDNAQTALVLILLALVALAGVLALPGLGDLASVP